MNDYNQLCHHNVGLLCYKYLWMNDYNRHMVNRIRLPSFLGSPNICHHNVGLLCYKYLCMNDYSQICHYNLAFHCYKYLWMITTGI